MHRISAGRRTPLLRQGPCLKKTAPGAGFSCCAVYC